MSEPKGMPPTPEQEACPHDEGWRTVPALPGDGGYSVCVRCYLIKLGDRVLPRR